MFGIFAAKFLILFFQRSSCVNGHYKFFEQKKIKTTKHTLVLDFGLFEGERPETKVTVTSDLFIYLGAHYRRRKQRARTTDTRDGCNRCDATGYASHVFF